MTSGLNFGQSPRNRDQTEEARMICSVSWARFTIGLALLVNNTVMLPPVHRIFSYPMGDRHHGDGGALLGAEDNLRSFEGVRYLLEAPRAKYR